MPGRGVPPRGLCHDLDRRPDVHRPWIGAEPAGLSIEVTEQKGQVTSPYTNLNSRLSNLNSRLSRSY